MSASVNQGGHNYTWAFRFPSFPSCNIVDNTCCISWDTGARKVSAEVTCKVTQYRCHSMGHIGYDCLLIFHCNYVSILYSFRDFFSVISQKFKSSRDSEYISLCGYSIMRALVLVNINLHNILETSGFSHSKDMLGTQKCKMSWYGRL